MQRHLITSAIPYINGVKHLGNLIGSQLPADLYARYQRARGNEVLFLCATDEHGTPAELAAAKANQDISEYCEEMHTVQAQLADGFRLSFDQILLFKMQTSRFFITAQAHLGEKFRFLFYPFLFFFFSHVQKQN